MQVSIEKLEGLECKIRVELPAEALESSYKKRMSEASKHVRMDGFRPGKVPRSVIEKRYGASIRQEAVNDLIQGNIGAALEEAKAKPAGMPQVDSIEDEKGKPFVFTAIYEEMPEVKIADLSALSVEKPEAEVTDADLDEMIETLCMQRATEKEVKRKSKKGEIVELDYEGLKDGEAFDGGTAKNQRLELGSGQMIPGFEDGIIGMKAGEEKAIDVTFPEDYQNEDLKGQAVVFNISVHKVLEKVPAELNEEFIKSMGVESGAVDDFKAEIRKNMKRELAAKLEATIKEKTLAALREANSFDMPKALIAQEIQRLKQDMMRQFGGQGIDESMLPDDMFKERAEKATQAGLLLRQIIDDNKVEATPDKIRAYIEEKASAYEDPEEMINYYYSDDQLLNHIEGVVLENETIAFILSKAKVTVSQQSYSDVMKPAEA